MNGPPFPSPGELLPHGPPLVFLDRIVDAGPDFVLCELTVRIQPGVQLDGAAVASVASIASIMGVEYMAQAVAVFAGLKAEPARRRDVGYVISIRGLELQAPSFRVGEVLAVRATWRWGADRLGRFETSVSSGAQQYAVAQMSVYRPDVEEYS